MKSLNQLPPSHSPKEVSLLGLAEATDPDMREQLLLENVLSILYPLVTSDPWLGTTHTDKVQSHILFLDHKSLIQ